MLVKMRNNPREHLLNLHRTHVRAWEQKSFDHFRHLYSHEAVIFNIVPPPRFSDFKSFENTLQQYFAQIKEVSVLTSNIQIEVEGDVAWITSQYLMAYHQNGQLFRQNGRWTEVYRQDEEGEWKLMHLHSSPDPLEQSAPQRKKKTKKTPKTVKTKRTTKTNTTPKTKRTKTTAKAAKPPKTTKTKTTTKTRKAAKTKKTKKTKKTTAAKRKQRRTR